MRMSELSWARWFKEGEFLSYQDEAVRRYKMVLEREFARYVWTWPESVAPRVISGPHTVEDLETTKMAHPGKAVEGGQIWQLIFGWDKQLYYYVHLPTDVDRHGVAKKPKPTVAFPTVAHYEPDMSPFQSPSFITEHFLARPITPLIALSCYNQQAITLRPKVNFLINRLGLEDIGEEEKGKLTPAEDRFAELLDKLYRHVTPCRPISLLPVRAPAVAPT